MRSQHIAAQQKIVEVAGRYAAVLIGSGMRPAQVENRLIEHGVDPYIAAIVMWNLLVHSAARRDRRARGIVAAVAWSIGGILLLPLILAIAHGAMGTTIAWCALGCISIQLLQTLTRYNNIAR